MVMLLASEVAAVAARRTSRGTRKAALVSSAVGAHSTEEREHRQANASSSSASLYSARLMIYCLLDVAQRG